MLARAASGMSRQRSCWRTGGRSRSCAASAPCAQAPSLGLLSWRPLCLLISDVAAASCQRNTSFRYSDVGAIVAAHLISVAAHGFHGHPTWLPEHQRAHHRGGAEAGADEPGAVELG